MTVTGASVVTKKFLFGTCDSTIHCDVGTGNFLLVLRIVHVCGHADAQSHVSPGMDF